MKVLSPASHLGAISLAVLLVFGLKIQNLDVGPIVGLNDVREIRVYTPIFPGLANINQHEIFSPQYSQTKKIVLLGASGMDSVGCDSTWSKPERFLKPNAMYSCSIAAQMNKQLSAAGIAGWHVFNLARNGAGLTPMIYVYSQIYALRPEIVIYGDDFPFLFVDNADANDLSAEQYLELDSCFGALDETKGVWKAYREHLLAHGLRPRSQLWTDRPRRLASALVFGQDESEASIRRATIGNLLTALFTRARDNSRAEAPLRPIRFIQLRNWEETAGTPSITRQSAAAPDSPDPGFAYSQGLTLISKLQEAHGGTMSFSVLPNYDHRGNTQAAATAEAVGGYLRQHGVLYKSNIELRLRPVYETYDGAHQTLYGNRIVAATLLADLRTAGLLR